MNPVALLTAAYTPLIDLADGVDEQCGWAPTRLPGWTVRDLLFHLASDAQRALVALGTPSSAAADTDNISYWSHWKPGTEGADAGRRGTRIMASAWTSVRGPAGLYAETARAVLTLVAREDMSAVVETQGHRLTVESLVRTLVVEAGVHHLDLCDVVQPAADVVLAEIRHTLDGLLGEAAGPVFPDDTRYAFVGTGREPLSDVERAALGARASRFPLFG
jgi:hypothetical protein